MNKFFHLSAAFCVIFGILLAGSSVDGGFAKQMICSFSGVAIAAAGYRYLAKNRDRHVFRHL